MFPAPRREWKDAGLKPKLADVDLHLVGECDVLAIVEFGNQVTSSPKLFVSNDRTGANAVEVALRSPDHMPDTQGDAVELYSHTAWTAKIPGELVTRGMQIFVEWAEGEKTWSDITVGAPTPFELVSLPLYFFGAHPDDTKDGLGHPLTPELAGRMPTSVEAEYRERLPISRFHTRLHPARFFRSDHAVVGPRLGDGVSTGKHGSYASGCSFVTPKNRFAEPRPEPMLGPFRAFARRVHSPARLCQHPGVREPAWRRATVRASPDAALALAATSR